jgi:mRNA interferase MazF
VDAYVPRKADIVWLDFEPQMGREINKRRPALVISSTEYNAKTKLAVFCPITSKVKGYPFEVELPDDLPVKGVIFADQLKNFDWSLRKAEFICHLPSSTFNQVIVKVNSLIANVDPTKTLSTDKMKEALDKINAFISKKVISPITLEVGYADKHIVKFNGCFLVGAILCDGFENPKPFYIDQIPEIDSSLNLIPYRTHILYFSETGKKLILYENSVDVDGDEEGSFITSVSRLLEIRNLRNFIDQYPYLAKQLDLSIPLDTIPLEEMILDII